MEIIRVKVRLYQHVHRDWYSHELSLRPRTVLDEQTVGAVQLIELTHLERGSSEVCAREDILMLAKNCDFVVSSVCQDHIDQLLLRAAKRRELRLVSGNF